MITKPVLYFTNIAGQTALHLMKIRTVAITITGRVQGVFFRKHTLNKANEMQLKGYVQNKSDKSVYIEVTGTEEQLKKFIAWCHQGAPASTVAHVAVKDLPFHHEKSFQIKYI
jgi:acylphosphatase